MWVVHVINLISTNWLYRFGLVPREIAGLDGLFGAPFLHANFQHLVSNTLGLIALGGLVSLQGNSTFVRVTVVIALVGGMATWLFAQYAIHIGASGLIFGYFGYLLARGLVEKTLTSLIITCVVIIMYSSLLWGVLPHQQGISWEGHLFGFFAGILAARWRVHAQ